MNDEGEENQTSVYDKDHITTTEDENHDVNGTSTLSEDTVAKLKELFPDSTGVDDELVSKLSDGLLQHYLPSLLKTKGTLGELTENQRILIETLLQENAKFSDCTTLAEVSETMEKATVYHEKLMRIKKEMHLLHEKSFKLKKRAVALQQQKQKEELVKEQEREVEAAKERQLIAKPVRRSESQDK